MYESTKVLIFGKTYPELSAKYTETVCTGGLHEDGRPIRLYPVPLRYLEGPQQYQTYQWVTVPIRKSTSDPRPESFKIDPSRLVCGERLDTDRGTWRRRTEMLERDRSWHFGGMAELHDAQARTGRSIGLVKPGQIDGVSLVSKPDSARLEYEQKKRELEAKVAADFFHPSYKQLEYLPHEIRLEWRCIERCRTCRKQPHGMKILDWGLLELARREGWDKALARMQEISDLRRYDFKLFLGTFRLHPKNFGVIGLWYPKLPDQPAFL